MDFQPQDPEFEARVRDSFGRQRAMSTFGVRINEVTAGAVELLLPFREDLTQQHGFLHAGVVTTVLDSACGYAAFTLMPADAAVLTIELKINLLSPARGDVLLARGRVIRAGRTITVCEAEGWMREGDSETQVALMVATVMALPNREGRSG